MTRDGVPKLLDFGIAKILDASLGADLTLARPMTLEYASPEQICGEAITTAADVYALGVVLYRLLTGRSPYRADARSPHDLSMAITTIEPAAPSVAAASPEVGRQLAGDLDNILRMALRKEPERRYQSVEQLVDDLEHHLNGRPVFAAPDSWRYRAGKFVRRHRIALAAAAALLLAIVAGAPSISSSGSSVAIGAPTRATARRRRIRVSGRCCGRKATRRARGPITPTPSPSTRTFSAPSRVSCATLPRRRTTLARPSCASGILVRGACTTRARNTISNRGSHRTLTTSPRDEHSRSRS